MTAMEDPGSFTTVLATIITAAIVISWAATVILLILIPFFGSPRQMPGLWKWNPFNIVFFTELLTPWGLRLRTCLIVAVATFICSLVTIAALDVVSPASR